jgi:hypothetical protein
VKKGAKVIFAPMVGFVGFSDFLLSFSTAKQKDILAAKHPRNKIVIVG